MNNSAQHPFAAPLYVMLKPVSAACNMRCDYCYYLDKKDLYPEPGKHLMSEQLLEKFTQQYLKSQTMPDVLFTWHGGEALLRDIGFYQKAMELQRQYSRGHRIDNCLQTNGTLLTDEWCAFFREHNFLIGISIDGTHDMHNRYRRYPDGSPSFDHVMRGVELLRKHGVEFNIMGVVNDYNSAYPLEFYRFFKSIDCRYIQFSPIVEVVDGKPAPWNVSARMWGDFLIAIFDEWVREDVGQFYVQYFDSTLANWCGQSPSVCSLAPTCGHAGVMEFNGDVYSCDHFVFPEYKLGNIQTHTLMDMMYGERQKQFGNSKSNNLPLVCRRCDHLFACHGECPKNRILKTPEGEKGLNYLCEGYRNFFRHVTPYMEFMKNELSHRRAPANIMEYLVLNQL